MAKSKNTPAKPATGKPNPWDRIPKLPADHPLFKAGWIIGQTRASNFSTRVLLCQICGRPVDEHLVGMVTAGLMVRCCSRCLDNVPLCKICGEAVWGQPNLSLCKRCQDSPWGDPEEEDQPPASTSSEWNSKAEGEEEAKAFAKHREAQRRPWPANPTKGSK